jgi:hypothetical protein
VALVDPGGGTALVHVEIEARFRPEIGLRLAGYQMQLRLRHGRPVLCIAVCLTRGRPGVSIESVVDARLGLEVNHFRYYSLCLAGSRAEEFLAREQPLAWALAALMRPESLSRAELKMACLRRIAAAPLNDLPRFLLVNCVETYLQLQGRDAEELEALQACGNGEEEVRAMKAIRMTWAEQLEAKGIEKGMERGVRQTLLYQLGVRFGPLSDEIRRRVEAISSVERLNQIAEQILVARSLEEMGLR